jgi:hypothetical protein
MKYSIDGRGGRVQNACCVKRGTRAESNEAYRVRTFARIFGLTRQVIINDDLGAFSPSPMPRRVPPKRC